MKKLSPWCLAAVATMAPLGAIGGMTGTFAGHLAILAVTAGIFFGTLSLGRPSRGTPLPDAPQLQAKRLARFDKRSSKRFANRPPAVMMGPPGAPSAFPLPPSGADTVEKNG